MDGACRGLVRQLGKPAFLAAQYKGDTAGVASAALTEMEGSMTTALQQLSRLYLAHGGALPLLKRLACTAQLSGRTESRCLLCVLALAFE